MRLSIASIVLLVIGGQAMPTVEVSFFHCKSNEEIPANMQIIYRRTTFRTLRWLLSWSMLLKMLLKPLQSGLLTCRSAMPTITFATALPLASVASMSGVVVTSMALLAEASIALVCYLFLYHYLQVANQYL